MELWEVYHDFYTLKEINFSKGYKEYEMAYEELKDELKLKREEIDKGLWTLVKITKEDK